jgi:NTP pyrophosphatase (non-canonical NTP hydrolase)
MKNIIRQIQAHFKNSPVNFKKQTKVIDFADSKVELTPEAIAYCLRLKEENDRLREALTSCWHAANDYSGEYAKACDGVMTIASRALHNVPEEDESSLKEENLKNHAQEIRRYIAKLEKWMVTPGWKTVHLAAYTMDRNEELKRTVETLRSEILQLKSKIIERQTQEVRQAKAKEYGFNEYQREASETAIYREEVKIIYPALGLSEAGEVQGKVKKVLRDKGGVFDEEIKREIGKELGDVLWYIAALSRDLELSMESIAKYNIEKLRSRKARGVIGGSGDNR